jgi:chromosome segregation ATPase
MMRRNEAHKPIPQDQIDGSPMEARVARIESDVAKIQVDVRELRVDMKAANESIADLRVAVAKVDSKIDAATARLDHKIDASTERLDGRIDSLNAKVDTNHVALRVSLSEMTKSISDLRDSIAGLRESIGDLKGSQRVMILILLGAGVFSVLAKVFHWV